MGSTFIVPEKVTELPSLY